MRFQYTIYLVPLIASTAICLLLAIFAWRRRPAPGATALAVLMLGTAIWSLGYALRLASVDLTSKLFWAKARYVGVVLTPAAWLAFAIRYTGYGRRWLTPWTVAILALEPAIVLFLVWINETHHLFWTETRLEQMGALTLLITSHGPVFWAHTVYSYVLLVIGSALLTLLFVRAPGLYREQAAAVLTALLLPLAGSVLSIFQVFPVPLDLIPFAFTLAGLALAWGLFRSRLLEITPIARDAIIEVMPQAAVVLDAQGRVVDLNSAAERLLGLAASESIGLPAERVLAAYPALQAICRKTGEVATEFSIGYGEERRTYEARLSPLEDAVGRSIGHVLFIHDVTERKETEAVLQRGLERLRLMAEIAQLTAFTREVSEFLEQAVSLILEKLICDWVSVFLLDDRRQYAIMTTVAGESEPGLERGRRWRVGEAGIVGEVMHSGQPRVVVELPGEDTAAVGPLLSGARSVIAVPLRVGRRVIGVVEAQSRRPRAFDENDAAALQTVADQLAAFIENARLIREMETAVRELELASGRAARARWQAPVREVDRPLGYRSGELGVERSDEPYPEAVQACRERRPVSVTVGLEGDGRGGVGALAVPITLRGQVIGAVDVRYEGERVPPELAQLLQEVAERLALALENARLLEETRRRAVYEQIRAEIASRVRASADVDTILRTAVRELGRTLQASEGLIRLELIEEGPPSEDKLSTGRLPGTRALTGRPRRPGGRPQRDREDQ